jgi:hypothetical protein
VWRNSLRVQQHVPQTLLLLLLLLQAETYSN